MVEERMINVTEDEDGIDSVLATLQPLRDLAKNWDIDIASCLEEYLHDLVGHIPDADKLTETTVDGPSLNFAQAALVLQNSSNIYSRKVEYLYALVYKSLEDNFLAQNGKVARQRHTDPDIDDFLSFDPYQEFLLLDDVLPTDDSPDNCKIDLVEHEKVDLGSTPGRSMTRLSLTANKSVTAINDVAYKTLLDPQGSTLRLLKAPVSEDGWLRLPGTSSNKRASLSTPVSPFLHVSHEESGREESADIQTGFGTFDDENGNDDDGPGFAMIEDEDELPSTAPQVSNNKQTRQVTFAEPTLSSKDDPWALLDPHSIDNNSKARPLKVGKSTRLPEGISEPPSACVTGARTRRIARPNVPSSQTDTAAGKRRFDAIETFKHACQKLSLNECSNEEKESDPLLPLQGLAYGDEFNYIYQATTKRLAAKRRQIRQQEQSRTSSAIPYDDDDDDFGGGFAYGDDDDADDYAGEGNTGMTSLDEVYGRDNSENFSTGATFEELCKAHLQAFAREAEKYASETKLSQRVDQWQEKLQPLLKEEEERPVFDIHDYGNQVIESMESEITRHPQELGDKPSTIVDFSKVTRNKPNFEVCRLFLACLSLTNSGNVRFAETSADGNSLSMELLKREVELPTENYLAPSVRESSDMVL